MARLQAQALHPIVSSTQARARSHRRRACGVERVIRLSGRGEADGGRDPRATAAWRCEAVTSARRLAELLTEHLREVSRDLHLQVNLIPSAASRSSSTSALRPGQAMEERRRADAARRNGFARVERLEGNIGYIDLRGFMPPEIASETAAAAMTFLGGTDAIIFDVRQNGGGSPEMVAFLGATSSKGRCT